MRSALSTIIAGNEAMETLAMGMPAETESLDALYQRAKALLDEERLDEAAALYRRILERDPAQSRAHNNLGTVLEAQGRPEEAMESYRRALELSPGNAATHYNVGHLYQMFGQPEGAAQAYRFAIALRRDYPAAYFNLTHALLDLGRDAEAAAAVERWLQVNPWDERAIHLRAALTGREVPERASDGFIREVFDRMAGTFDAALAALDYRAPQLVADALAARVAGATGLDVLDAGCGTGLGGPLLRACARRLVGVDLSEGMLEQARHRGAYDELVAAEIGAFLAREQAAWDVVVSADTLVYFGALEPVLAAMARALRPGGWLVFTLEELADDAAGKDYRLNASGRYSHAQGYARRVLGEAGFEVASVENAVLRLEAGEPVMGLVFAARRAAGA